jgi:hypothetical protein
LPCFQFFSAIFAFCRLPANEMAAGQTFAHLPDTKNACYI